MALSQYGELKSLLTPPIGDLSRQPKFGYRSLRYLGISLDIDTFWWGNDPEYLLEMLPVFINRERFPALEHVRFFRDGVQEEQEVYIDKSAFFWKEWITKTRSLGIKMDSEDTSYFF